MQSLTELAREGNARFGVLSNTIAGVSTGFHSFGIAAADSSVMLARTVLYFGRATTAGGSLASAMKTLHASFALFLREIGFVGKAALVAIAAWGAYKLLTMQQTEELEKRVAVIDSFVLEP